jgi:hypothetical protein
MAGFVKNFPEPGSFDKPAVMGIFVNKFLDPGIFDKNPIYNRVWLSSLCLCSIVVQ